ncbi:MAG: AMP-binding protein, partial [Polyangiaceae bacterium]
MPEKTRSYVPPTLVDAIADLAKRERTGFTFVRSDGSERYVPYPEVRVEAARRGAHLLSLGMNKGDRLAMVIPDGDEFVLSFLGAVYAGIVPVPIYPQLSFKNIESYHDTVAHIARASGAKRLLTTPSTREYVEPVRANAPSLEAITVTSDFANAPAATLDTRVDPNDLCFLQFTSGSTSRPKGVMVSHGNLSANCAAFMGEGLQIDPKKDVGVSWLPLFHDMGLIGFVLGPLFCE